MIHIVIGMYYDMCVYDIYYNIIVCLSSPLIHGLQDHDGDYNMSITIISLYNAFQSHYFYHHHLYL